MEHNVANTILRQLGGINRLVAMTGAYNFIDRGNGVSFKIKNAKANYIKITLNGKDLYNLEIGRIRGTTYKVVLEQEDLYNDQLKPMIEKTTGMYLSFKEGGHLESDENGEMLKNQVTNILHHANELQKMLDGVKDVEPWVITKAQRSVTDLADITHYLEGESKKMADGGYMARGGIVQYVNEKDSWKLSRANTNNLPKDIFAKVENMVAHMQFAGNMLVAEGRKKYHEEYLYFLDDYDKDVTKDVKLKQDEKLFRYVSYTTAIGGMSPLVKINVNKALVYYAIYDEQDPEKIQFHTKGVRAEYINLIQDPRNYEEGGVVSESDFDSLKKGDKISITYSSGISRSNKVDLIVKSKTLVGKGKSWESEKITFVNVANPNGVNYYAYKRKGGKVSFAIGDMAIWGVKISNEMADGGYMANGDEILEKIEDVKRDAKTYSKNNRIRTYVFDYKNDRYSGAENSLNQRFTFGTDEDLDYLKDEGFFKYHKIIASYTNGEADSNEMADGGYMAKGGIVVTKIADIPNFKERLEEGRITYRGLGAGKLANDFYKIAGTSGVRIKVDGVEYFITDEEFDTFSRDKNGMMRIRFAAPKRKFEDGGHMDESVDLFEDYQNIPANVQDILDKYSEAFEDGDYAGLGKAKKALKKIGYTFDYDLDGQAYGLRKMAMGGETFEGKVKSIKSSLLSRKKVSPSVQKDYGKTYSPKEAEDSAKRIVGAMTARERMKTKMRSKKSK